MNGTALLYSSHNRGNWIHNDFIVQRALRGNKQILFLPMSETVQNGSELERQEFSWGTFRWFFDFYRQYGLQAWPFYWRSNLRTEDVDRLWHDMWNAEVVILGGGNPGTGLQRYKQLGAVFDNEPGKFGRLLHERAARGLLTVGFSAGSDQLGEYLYRATKNPFVDNKAFGLARNVMTMLHYESGHGGGLANAARQFPHCMAFGLPNDSGINVAGGRLPSGNWWQVIEFVIDNSWAHPRDHWHIKTRMGEKIHHIGCDGRHWAFNGGDYLVRIQSDDNRFHEAWMTSHGRLLHYWTRRPSGYRSIEQILASH